jgi:hypothetical protein
VPKAAVHVLPNKLSQLVVRRRSAQMLGFTL